MKAKVIENTKWKTLHKIIQDNVEPGSNLFTDDFKSYRNLKDYFHQYVKHSAGECVNEMTHINGIESFWSMLKRAHKRNLSQIQRKAFG